MTDAWAIVIAAAIPVVGGGVGYLIKVVLEMKNEQRRELNEFREENRSDHGIVMNALAEVREDVKEIRRAQHDHLEWHATQVEKAKAKPKRK